MIKYTKNEIIEVFVPNKGWCKGRYVMSNSDDKSDECHVIECPSLWYGPIKTPNDKVRKAK